MSLLCAGTVLFLWCVRAFYDAGKGTLAPWAPPRELVTVGPYRFSRNPMYVAVAMVLLGWAAGFWSRTLLIYALAVIVAFHLRIILGEEPWLARTFGESWQHYSKRVPRWLVLMRAITPAVRSAAAVPRQVMLCLAIALSSSSVAAEHDAVTGTEVAHLISHLGSSRCQFNRNGTWYVSSRAVSHLKRKYEYLLKRNLVPTRAPRAPCGSAPVRC